MKIMEDLLNKILVDPNKYYDHISDPEKIGYYDLEPDEADIKYKAESMMGKPFCENWDDNQLSPISMQSMALRKIHQKTLKYIFLNCKEDLLQYKSQLENLPPDLQKELASDMSDHLCFCNMEDYSQWIIQILPVVDHLNEKKQLVLQFQDDKPRFIDAYLFLMLNYLITDVGGAEMRHDYCFETGECGRISIDITSPYSLIFLANEGHSNWEDDVEFFKDYKKQKCIDPNFTYCN